MDLLPLQRNCTASKRSGNPRYATYLWWRRVVSLSLDSRGDILTLKGGNPTKGSYWFPSFNGTEGLKALEFFKGIINTGITHQNYNFEENFANRKFVICVGGSWIQDPSHSIILKDSKRE